MCVRDHNKDDHSSDSDDKEEFRGMVDDYVVPDEIADEDDQLADEDEENSRMMEDDKIKDDRRRRHKRCHCTKMSPTCFFETYDIFAMESSVDLRNDRKGTYRNLVNFLNIGVAAFTLKVVHGG